MANTRRLLLLVFLLFVLPAELLALPSNGLLQACKNATGEEKTPAFAQNQAISQLFTFGSTKKASKGIRVSSPLMYNPTTGYGFDFNSAPNVQIKNKAFSIEKSAYFSVKLLEGNYRITVTMGSKEKATNVTIKAESRRLLLGALSIKKGRQVTKTFAVNVKTPQIENGTVISLKDRELSDLNWDDKLTLEFLGTAVIEKIEIVAVTDVTTVFLAGDSTVTDQDLEPWASWGQFISSYFDANTVVANYAYSGASLSSFKASGRLKKILSLLKPGDYLIVEFGHNDEKIKGEENGPWRSYSDLLTEFVRSAKEKGAVPILATPTQRRFFKEDGTLQQTHGDFPDAMRGVAKKNNVALVDLTAMTTELYESWGDEGSRKAFVQYPANTFPGQKIALADNTHFNSFGANEIALCVLTGIRNLNLPLKHHINRKTPSYNPKKPNSISNWTLPMSSRFEAAKPEGN